MGLFSSFPFWKVQSTGNDFVIIDLRDESRSSLKIHLSDPDKIIKLCRRRFGVGADGLVLLEDSNDADLKWTFLNSDGSSAEMCGNASRAVAAVGFEVLELEDVFTFQSAIGAIRCERIEHQIYRCSWTISLKTPETFPLEIKGVERAFFVNTGVPHLVLHLDHWPMKNEVRSKVKSLRKHKDLGPGGANVTLSHPRNDVIHAITFERGVEDFTLSCGTGVIAAAMSYVGTDTNSEVEVMNPGGLLKVELNQRKSTASLSGPASIVFEGYLNKELLNG